jgi:hypothetical protein
MVVVELVFTERVFDAEQLAFELIKRLGLLDAHLG